MSDHRRCRRAATGPAPEPGLPGGTFACDACGEPLGSWIRRAAGDTLLEARRDLQERPQRHGDLPTFGLPDRARLHGRDPRHPRSVTRAVADERGGEQGRRPLSSTAEVYAYCPNPACGRGQHLAPPSG